MIRNTQDPRLDQPGRSLRDELGLPEDAFVLVTVGNAKPSGMALDEALEAIRCLPEVVHWAFLGLGYEELAARARRLGVDSRVHALAPVSPQAVTAKITGCQLSPIPYYPVTSNMRLAMPNGLFHAVTAGIPVAAPGALDELAETVRRYGIGVTFDPIDPSSLCAVVEDLRANQTKLQAMSAATERARSDLSWETDEACLRRLVEPLV